MSSYTTSLLWTLTLTLIAQVLLYYFPSVDGSETMPVPSKTRERHARMSLTPPDALILGGSLSTGSLQTGRLQDVTLSERKPGLMTFWQDLYLEAEPISHESPNRLHWMRPPSKKLSSNVPVRCYDRIKGFLFLDDGFKPTSHKTMIAPKDHAFGVLVRGEIHSALTEKYASLSEELGKLLGKWHEKHDDEEKYEGDGIINMAESSIWWAKCYCRGVSYSQDDKISLKIKGQSKKQYGEVVRFATPSDQGSEPKNGEVHVLLAGSAPGTEPARFSTRLLESKVSDSAWKKVMKDLKKSLPANIVWVRGHDAPAGELCADVPISDVGVQIQNSEGGTVSKAPVGILLKVYAKAVLKSELKGHGEETPAKKKKGKGGKASKASAIRRITEPDASDVGEEYTMEGYEDGSMEIHRASKDMEFNLPSINIKTAGTYLFAFVAINSPNADQLPAAYTNLAMSWYEVEVLPGHLKELKAEWATALDEGEVGPMVRMGASLPQISLSTLDKQGNMVQGQADDNITLALNPPVEGIIEETSGMVQVDSTEASLQVVEPGQKILDGVEVGGVGGVLDEKDGGKLAVTIEIKYQGMKTKLKMILISGEEEAFTVEKDPFQVCHTSYPQPPSESIPETQSYVAYTMILS